MNIWTESYFGEELLGFVLKLVKRVSIMHKQLEIVYKQQMVGVSNNKGFELVGSNLVNGYITDTSSSSDKPCFRKLLFLSGMLPS